MRHALVAEAGKAEMRSRISKLEKECEDLDDLISELENKTKEMVKAEESEREETMAAHKKWKDEMALVIYDIKDAIDTELQNPNIIA